MRHTLLQLVILGALMLSTLPAAAQDYNLPPGNWWENERIVQHLELTAGQQSSIKDLVYRHATRMIDFNAGMEKAKLALANQVEQEPLDPSTVRKAFETFQEARRSLETERFEMLLSVRQVVTHQQWRKLLSLRERLETIRQRNAGPRQGYRQPKNGTRSVGGQRN